MKKIRFILFTFLLLVVSITLFNTNNDKMKAASNYSSGDKVFIGNDSYTVIDPNTMTLLKDSVTDAGDVTWNDAVKSLTNLAGNYGELGSKAVSNHFSLPTTTDLSAVTNSGNTALVNIDPITNDWWLGDESVDNRSKFVGANTNSLVTNVSIIKNVLDTTAHVCNENQSVTEEGIKPTETGNDPDTQETYTSTYFNIKRSVSPGNTVARITGFQDLNCKTLATTISSTASPAIVNVEVDSSTLDYTNVLQSVPDQRYMPKYVFHHIAFNELGMGDYLKEYISNPSKGYDRVFEIPIQNKVCQTLKKPLYFVNVNGTESAIQSYKVVDSPNINLATVQVTEIKEGTATTIDCPGAAQVAGTSYVRPLLTLNKNKIAYSSLTKPSYNANIEVNQSVPEINGNSPYLTLIDSDLGIALDSGNSAVSGKKLTIDRSNTTVSIPVSLSGTTSGIRYVSVVAKTNNGDKYTVLGQVNGTVGTVQIDLTSLADYESAKTLNLTLYQEVDEGTNTTYRGNGTQITLDITGSEKTIELSIPDKIIYGDHFTIKSLQDDSSSTNVKYTFEVDNATYISNPTVNGSSAIFDALKYSGTTNIQIKVTRTADGEVPLSKTITVQVLPKPIEIIIDDKEKYKGEVNPTLTYQDLKKQLVSWNGVQDTIQANDIKLSTTAKTDSNAGAYPIKGDSNILNKTYPNYSFTFKEGTLTIKEENIEDDWYHLEIDDGNNTLYTGRWTNKDVNIISDHDEYINMSLDQSTWKPSQVTVIKEGETNQSFWMKKDSGAITKEKQEIIKIDKTAPKVKGIKAKDTNNKLQDIINKLSGGIFFKPGTSFEITTSDKKNDLKVSGTKEIAYKVFKITDETEEQIKDGTLSVTNEKAKITISETVGKYKVCVIPTDNADNTGTESCHELELKKIDVDVDGDGKPDFNDPDGDGCPDLNIKWKDPNDESKWIVINGDRDYDGIPDINIDSDGDGKSDLNIDTDNDGQPDLNLVILKKSDWKPTECVKQDIDNGILEEYCTGTSVKAKINVDTDGDGIPNINIDNKGDFKPHINIAKDGTTPSVNIVEIHEWKPKKDYKSGKFTFDSLGKGEIKPEINIDTDGDGLPDVNVDLDGDGEPDINIDVDGDGIPDIDIDGDGDGIPDVNVDTDGDGKPDENIKDITEWKPNKNVDGDIPYDTMDFNNTDNADKPADGNDTPVKGQYNPITSMGGANTGDNTNILFVITATFISLVGTLYMIIRIKNKQGLKKL